MTTNPPSAPLPASPIAVEFTLARVGQIVASGRFVLYRATAAVVAAVALITLTSPRTWTVQASFVPQAKNANVGSLGGLAAQFGVALPFGDGGESPEFYVALLRSRPVLSELLRTQVPAGIDAEGTKSLFSLLSPDDTTSRGMAGALRTVQSMVQTDVDPSTSIVRLRVTTEEAALSLVITERLVALLEQFNLETRQSRALAERRFTEQRMQEAQEQLRRAENTLESFVQENREFGSSPRLTLVHQRLSREVTLRQQLFSTIADAFEQARIEEVRDTPVLTVIEPPSAPLEQDRRRLLLKLVLGILAAIAVSALWVFWRAYASELREREPVSGPNLLEAVLEDARHPLRTLAAVARGKSLR